MAHSVRQDDRLDVRISTDDKDLIEAAATLKGQKMSAFVIESMRSVSKQIIESAKTISVSDAAWTNFVAMLENPPEPTESLRRAVRSLKKHS
jgi:uncharacterized protein (DUF1778 family)